VKVSLKSGGSEARSNAEDSRSWLMSYPLP